MTTRKYNKVKMQSKTAEILKRSRKWKRTSANKKQKKSPSIIEQLEKKKYIEAKQPTRKEMSKYKSSTKNYDDAYLKAFYRKNKTVIDHNLRNNKLLPLYGDNPYRLFRQLVHEKMFNQNKTGSGLNYKSRKEDPWEKKVLSTREAVAKVYNSKDMYGEKQVQIENFKKMLKKDKFKPSDFKDEKGRIVSLYDMELDKEESDKENGVYVYKVGTTKITIGKYKGSKVGQWYNVEYNAYANK